MELDQKQIQKITAKYNGLLMADSTRDLLLSDPKKFLSYCNGVGSRVGFWGKLTYHFISNCIWGLDITPATDIHDVEYCEPLEFQTIMEALRFKSDTDVRLFCNLSAVIRENTRWNWLRVIRLRRARFYFDAVTAAGQTSFLENKTIVNPEYV